MASRPEAGSDVKGRAGRWKASSPWSIQSNIHPHHTMAPTPRRTLRPFQQCRRIVEDDQVDRREEGRKEVNFLDRFVSLIFWGIGFCIYMRKGWIIWVGCNFKLVCFRSVSSSLEQQQEILL